MARKPLDKSDITVHVVFGPNDKKENHAWFAILELLLYGKIKW